LVYKVLNFAPVYTSDINVERMACENTNISYCVGRVVSECNWRYHL